MVLPYSAKAYYNFLLTLEDAFADGHLSKTIRSLTKTYRTSEEVGCLVYLIKRLYPDHYNLIEKLAILV